MSGNSPTDLADQYGFLSHNAAGGLTFFSGVVGVEADGTAPADPAQQYALAFDALDAALLAARRTKADIVDIMTFHAEYPNHMGTFMAAKSAFLGSLKTTWTAIGVAALGTPGSLVEIRMVARA